MNSIWDNCLTKLENEIASSDFSTWIRPLQVIENNGILTLLAPNRFVLDWVKQHYFIKIKQSVNDLSNGSLQLSIEIGSKKTVAPSITNNTKPIEVKNSKPNFLNKTFTFDNFVIGKSNQLARAASIQVAENIDYLFWRLFPAMGGQDKPSLLRRLLSKSLDNRSCLPL